MLGPMELRHLRYFVAVAEVENASLAAQRLRVSQPLLSRQIRQLEEELGVDLFERSPKSLRLTKAGKVFEREARQILEQADRAANRARAAAAVCSGELRIGYAPSLTVKILPQSLRTFERAHPSVKMRLYDLSTAEMLKRLKAKALDVALVAHPGKMALRGLAFRELGRHPAYVALPVSHPLAKARSIRAQELVREKVVAFSPEDYPEYHKWLASLFRGAGGRPKPSEAHDSVAGLIAAVEAGRGVAFGGEGLRELVGRRARARPLAPPAPPIVVGAVWAENAASETVRRFLDALGG